MGQGTWAFLMLLTPLPRAIRDSHFQWENDRWNMVTERFPARALGLLG